MSKVTPHIIQGNDFVYKDDYKDNLQNYLEITGQVDEAGKKNGTNTEAGGRYHTNWLNMMYPRLRLARNLLKDDGVIFISIDDNEVDNLKKICDEIFGEENFIGKIIWQKKTGASDAKNIAIITEYIIVYLKNSIKNNERIFERNKEAYDIKRYRLEDKYKNERGPYYIDNLDRGGLQYSDSLNFPIICPDGTKTYPNGRRDFKNDGWIWKWSKKKVEWAIENDFIEFRKSETKKSGWAVCYKNYLLVNNENKKIDRSAPLKNMITKVLNANSASNMKELFGSIIFPYSKPTELIKQIISYIKFNNDEIILDFFSGSSTTAHAVMQLNVEDGGTRKFIMVQLPEETDEKSEAYKAGYKNISEIGKERIRRAGEKIIEENRDKEGIENLDVGFKVFKLDSSNLKKWNPDYDNLEMTLDNMIDNFVEGRSEEDVLYEIMLKFGVNLTYSVETIDISGKRIFNIGFGALMVCLDDDITLDVVERIVKLKDELKPEITRVVLKDNGFKNDTVKTNAIQILNRNNIDEVMSI